jgi:mono/diheme cytochrome c family protein
MRNVFLVFMLILSLIFVWKNAARAQTGNESAEDADLGRRVYLWTGCGNCHGFDARGGWRGPDLTDPRLLRVRSDDDLFAVIKHGRRDTMMAFYWDELADDQIRSIVSYLRDEGGKRAEAPAPAAR